MIGRPGSCTGEGADAGAKFFSLRTPSRRFKHFVFGEEVFHSGHLSSFFASDHIATTRLHIVCSFVLIGSVPLPNSRW